MFSWRAATEANISLKDMQDGWCSTCTEWLRSQSGTLKEGFLVFEKRAGA
jgi:hypothetical protein